MKQHYGIVKSAKILNVISAGLMLLAGLLLLVVLGAAFCVAGMTLAGSWLLVAGLSPLLLFSLLVLVDSSWRNKSLWVGLLSIRASFTQLLGYGTGFLRAWWLRCVRGCNEELQAYRDNFYQ